MASPQFRSASAGTWFTQAESGTVPVPAGAQAGDVVIVAVHADDFDTGVGQSAMPGFTKITDFDAPSPHELQVFWKRLTAADTGTYTYQANPGEVSRADSWQAFAVCYTRVVATGSPFDGSPVTAAGSVNSTSTPSVSMTTTGAARRVIHIAMAGGHTTSFSGTVVAPTTTFTPASGYTARNTSVVLIADREQLAAGSTGGVVGTLSQNTISGAWLAALIGLDRTVTVGSGIARPTVGAGHSVLPGAAPVLPGAIAAPASPPGATVRGRNTVTVGSIGSPAAVPAPTLHVGGVTLGVSSVAAPAGPLAPSLRLQVTASSIVTAESVPAPAALAGDLVVPSIGSAQAFGTAAVLPGAAALAVASTASAAAFGAASVRLSIAPPAVGSASAFGTATLSAGAVSITAASVPSGLVVPSPWLQTQVLRTDPVPSLEHVNSPQLLLRIVVDDGIPGDTTIQSAPEVFPGAATILPVSVVSAEVVPATVRLTLSIDPTARGVRGDSAAAAVRYELLMMARLPQRTGPPTLLVVDRIDWLTINWADVLSKPQELEITCLIGGLTDPVLQRLRAPDRLATELHVARNGATVFAGPLMGGQKRGQKVTLTARGLLSYLRFMVISQKLWLPSSTDQHLLVRSMVDMCQNLPYGHFGIDTSDITNSGVYREGFWPEDELHNVADRLEDLQSRYNGFDVEVDPATRKMQCWSPRKGVDRSTGDDAVVFDSRNITSDDVMFSVAPGDLATHAAGTATAAGKDEVLFAEAENAELKAAFGRAVAAQSWSDVTTQADLQDHVQGLLDERDQALWVPGPNVRVDPDSDPTRYDVGDSVWFDAGGKIGVSGKFRVRERRIEVNEAGRETAELAFV